jgi:hypothetical protein
LSAGTTTGPLGTLATLAVSGVSEFATGFGARRLGASFEGTRVMVMAAAFGYSDVSISNDLKPKKRNLSPAARERIAAAQRKRWAEQRKPTAVTVVDYAIRVRAN